MTFLSNEQSDLDRKPSLAYSNTSTRRRRSLTTSRSIDERISFSGRRTLYTAGMFYFDYLSIEKIDIGRPAWFDASGETKEAFVIGICGGSASGKTTVAQRIVEKLNVPWVTLLSMDSFYKVSRMFTDMSQCCVLKVLTEEQHELAKENNYNFDHPDAFDFDLLNETLRNLKIGKQVLCFDFTNSLSIFSVNQGRNSIV